MYTYPSTLQGIQYQQMYLLLYTQHPSYKTVMLRDKYRKAQNKLDIDIYFVNNLGIVAQL